MRNSERNFVELAETIGKIGKMKYIRVLPAEFQDRSDESHGLGSGTLFPEREAGFFPGHTPNTDYSTSDSVTQRSAVGSAQLNAQPAERWLPAPDFQGRYEVSDLGRVRRISTGRILATSTIPTGYVYIHLRAGKQGGRHRCWRLHRLVMAAFCGERPDMTVNHKDGNKLNNRLDNLEYVTQQENVDHAWATGLQHKQAKTLTADDVREILPLRGVISAGKLALRYHVKRACIQQIWWGKIWNDVTGLPRRRKCPAPAGPRKGEA